MCRHREGRNKNTIFLEIDNYPLTLYDDETTAAHNRPQHCCEPPDYYRQLSDRFTFLICHRLGFSFQGFLFHNEAGAPLGSGNLVQSWTLCSRSMSVDHTRIAQR